MFKLTQISRISDDTPLAGTMTHENELNDLDKLKKERKKILKQLSIENPPQKLTVETSGYNFQ
jgi:hypothetical protein